jgi:hypothetical protein
MMLMKNLMNLVAKSDVVKKMRLLQMLWLIFLILSFFFQNDDDSQQSFEAETSEVVIKEEKTEKIEEKELKEEVCINFIKLGNLIAFDFKVDDEEEEEEDEDGDLNKYDLTADMELASFKVNLEILRRKMVIESRRDSMKKTNEQSAGDSDSLDSSEYFLIFF